MKLYWKVKINGKWTFRAAKIDRTSVVDGIRYAVVYAMEDDFNETQVP